ncbi:MAG: exonuclease domain-containing protein, partial [Bacilli bacterium]
MRFAIVDIETTGNKYKEDDRMIEIAICIVENGAIVDTFASLIQPNRTIPETIVQFTSIDNEAVSASPTFREISDIVIEKLEDCVFVAHNVFFDYTFLNAELERVGKKPLLVPKIDTVELCQVFLPTFRSFRLSDIAEQLHIPLHNAHRAIDDAKATAEIFITLQRRYSTLPGTVISYINRLSDRLKSDWIYFIAGCEWYHKEALPEPVHTIRGLSISKQSSNLQKWLDWAAVKEIFDTIDPTFSQDRTNTVFSLYENVVAEKNCYHAFHSVEEEWWIVTLAALVTHQRTEQPVVMSFASKEEELHYRMSVLDVLQKEVGQNITIGVAKAKRHFIDVGRLQKAMSADELDLTYTSIVRLMGMCVWLSETNTGDLSELNVRLSFDELVQRFGCTPSTSVEDGYFYHQFIESMQSSALVFTNHFYIVSQQHLFGEAFRFTMFLSAQELPRTLYNVTHRTVNVNAVVRQFEETDEHSIIGHFKELKRLLESGKAAELHIFEEKFNQEKERFRKVAQSLCATWKNVSGYYSPLTKHESLVSEQFRNYILNQIKFTLKALQYIESVLRKWTAGNVKRRTKDSLLQLAQLLKDQIQDIEQIQMLLTMKQDKKVWITYARNDELEFVVLHTEFVEIGLFSKPQSGMLFTSPLGIVQEQTSILQQLLHLDSMDMSYNPIAPLPLEKQVYTVEDGIDFKVEKGAMLLKKVDALLQQMDQSHSKKWIVLFPSADLLRDYYEYSTSLGRRNEKIVMFEQHTFASFSRLNKLYQFETATIACMTVRTFLREKFLIPQGSNVALLKLPFAAITDGFYEWEVSMSDVAQTDAFTDISVPSARRELMKIMQQALQMGHADRFYLCDTRVLKENYAEMFQKDLARWNIQY